MRPIIIYFHSSQYRLIPYLHKRPIFSETNSIHSSNIAILELIRGTQCLIEVIGGLRNRSGLTRGLPIDKIVNAKVPTAKTKQKELSPCSVRYHIKTPLRQSRHMHLRNTINGFIAATLSIL